VKWSDSDGWTSNWLAMRLWWDGDGSSETSGNKLKVLQDFNRYGYWTEAYSMYQNGTPFYICLEPVAWMNIYENGKNTGEVMANTAAGWAAYYKDSDYGDSKIMKMTNSGLPLSITLDRRMFGWDVPTKLSGFIKNDDIRSKGYGMNMILWNGTPTVSTADLTSSYPVTDPSSPYSVIKCYEDLETSDAEESPETEEYVPVNTYIYNHAPVNLTIEDETGYVVTDWEIIAAPISTVSDKQPYDEIVYGKTPIEHGDSAPQTVTLDDTKPTLVIRLRSDIEPTPPEPKEVRINGTKILTEV
jgi:hypothetical protein